MQVSHEIALLIKIIAVSKCHNSVDDVNILNYHMHVVSFKLARWKVILPL